MWITAGVVPLKSIIIIMLKTILFILLCCLAAFALFWGARQQLCGREPRKLDKQLRGLDKDEQCRKAASEATAKKGGSK